MQADQRANPKLKDPNYQYNKAQYHPIEEYLISKIEKLTSDTPAFVLEVTWPRVALFYHPASPLCIQLRDRYVAVAREIRRRSIRVPVEFWAVSCEVHRDACDDLDVTAVPRILAFPKGKIEGQVVPRTADNDIEVEKIIQIVGVELREIDEDEAKKNRNGHHKEDEVAQFMEIEEKAKAANDPYQLNLGDGDHLQEILHPHSDLSDVYADAMASLLNSIDGTTKKDKNGYIVPWSWDQYHAFREFLDLMHWSLPTRDMAKVHNIVNDLRNNIREIEDRPDVVTSVLASHDYYKTNPKWSASCRVANKADQGYACGFWKLLHIVSIGMVEQHASVLGDLQRVLAPHVTHTVREYVNFFGFAKSRDGKDLLLRTFDDCAIDEDCKARMGIKKKGLFARFRQRAIPPKTDKSWKELSIFLWEAHQEYRHKRLSKIQGGYESVDELQWPPSSLCPMCYSTQGIPEEVNGVIPRVEDENLIVDMENQVMWNKDKVFEHLKHEYWPRTLQTPRVVVLDRWGGKPLKELLHNEETGVWSVVSVILVIIGLGGLLRYFYLSRRNTSRFRRYKKGDLAAARQFGLESRDRSRAEGHRTPGFRPRRRINGRGVGYRAGSGVGPFLDD